MQLEVACLPAFGLSPKMKREVPKRNRRCLLCSNFGGGVMQLEVGKR